MKLCIGFLAKGSCLFNRNFEAERISRIGALETASFISKAMQTKSCLELGITKCSLTSPFMSRVEESFPCVFVWIPQVSRKVCFFAWLATRGVILMMVLN